MPEPKARVWFMPAGSELLGTDGKQAFYGNEDGLGSVTSAGYVNLLSIGLDEDEEDDA